MIRTKYGFHNDDALPIEEDRDIVRTLSIVQISDIIEMPEDVQVHESSQDIENDEISINYVSTGERWNRRENVALNIMHENEYLKPRTVKKCQCKK